MKRLLLVLMIATLAITIFAQNAPDQITTHVKNQKFGIFWDEPDASDALYWDTGVNGGAIGFGTSASDGAIAIKFLPQDLASYNGYTITHLSFFDGEPDTQYGIRMNIIEGGTTNFPSTTITATDSIHSTQMTDDEVNLIALTNPPTIDATQDLWIEFVFDSADPVTPNESHPWSQDDADLNGTHVGFGDLVWNGATDGYVPLTSLVASLTGNWNIRAYLSNGTRDMIPMTIAGNTVRPEVVPSSLSKVELRDPNFDIYNNVSSRLHFIKGFKVFKDNTLVEEMRYTTTDHKRFYYGEESVGQHNYYVSAIFDDMIAGGEVESPLSNPIVINITDANPQTAPRDVHYTVEEGNEPTVNWIHPGGALGETRMALPGDLEQNDYNSGYGIFTTYEFGIRFEAQDLVNYVGQSITNVRMVATDSLATYTLKIYEGGDVTYSAQDSAYIYNEGTLIYEEPIVKPNVYRENIVDLETPITIQANNEYWFTLKTTQYANDIFPMAQAGVAGEINNMKGNLIKFGSWGSMYREGDDIANERDHYLQIHISDLTTRNTTQEALVSETYPSYEGPVVSAPAVKAPYATLADVRDNDRASLEGWELNWNLNTPDAATYSVDLQYIGLILGGMDEGDYEYSVAALYDDQTSAVSDVHTCSIVLPTPDSLEAENINANYWRLTWLPPVLDPYSRGFQKYNIYSGASEENCDTFVAEADGEFYVTNNFDSTLTYKVVAVYGGEDNAEFESQGTFWSNGGNQAVGDKDIDFMATRIVGAYPNPFNPTTTIKYSIAKDDNVELVVYNIKGQKVRTLVNEKQDQGEHSIVWNGKDDEGHNSASGVYFYRLRSGNHTSTQKLMMIK